jgi:Kdo2-lipid IVA lauroyltransferase/acyltransferase
MQALSFYLLYPVIYVIASLPFRALYILSDVLYYLRRLSGYRRDVVLKNLRNSFPEKSPEEINNLCRSKYGFNWEFVVTRQTLKHENLDLSGRCGDNNQFTRAKQQSNRNT